MKNIFTLISFTFLINFTYGQMYSGEIDWIGNNTANNSYDSLVVCEDTILVELTTSPDEHDKANSPYYGTAFPALSTSSSLEGTITFTFSKSVENVRIRIDDLDEYRNGGSDVGSPIEYLDNFSPAFTSIDPVPGNPTYVAMSSNTGVDPAGNNNTYGWINWDGPLTQITFVSQRPDALSGGCAIHLKNIEFDLEKCREGASINPANVNEGFMSIAPNPTFGSFNIELPIKSGQIEIYSIDGKLLKQLSITNENMVIDASDLDNGSYIIVAKDKENYYTEKFIKQ